MDVEALRTACRDITHPSDPSQWSLGRCCPTCPSPQLGREAHLASGYVERQNPAAGQRRQGPHQEGLPE
eukprot:8235534-Pyramimonas_sp.AAC.1